MSELNRLLRELRGKESLRDVSKRVGLSHSYLSILEKGIDPRSKAPINPSPDTLKRLAEAYNYPYEKLMKVAGYIDEDHYDNSSVVKEAERLYDDPEFQLAMRSAQGFSEENKKKVLEYIEMIEELEKGRKPGDKQPRPKKR